MEGGGQGYIMMTPPLEMDFVNETESGTASCAISIVQQVDAMVVICLLMLLKRRCGALLTF